MLYLRWLLQGENVVQVGKRERERERERKRVGKEMAEIG